VKKSSFVLALLLTACGTQTLPAQNSVSSKQIQQFSNTRQANSAQSGLAIALQAVQKVDPNAQLYEIDIWQEQAGKSLQYGFLPSVPGKGFALRVFIDVESQTVKLEESPQGTQSQLVNREYWKIDSQEIYARAQANGLQDTYYLATLWEDTWHISGLKQNLYFQMDSQNAAIKLRCIGPYLDNCTSADGTPVKNIPSSGMQAHLQARQSRR
jgi:hypothetical protein